MVYLDLYTMVNWVPSMARNSSSMVAYMVTIMINLAIHLTVITMV
jgi:hypothetical protein